MDSRWFSPVVVLFWVATLVWLTLDKVLPQLREGSPPTYRSLLAQDDKEPTKWDLYIDDQAVGRSESIIYRTADGGARLIGELTLLARFPLRALIPEALSRRFLPDLQALPARGVSIHSEAVVNRENHLLGIHVTVQWGEYENLLKVSGIVQDNELVLTPEVLNGVKLPTMKYPISAESQLAESLSPQSRILGLRLGQTWSIPVFSPLQPTTPVEVLQAAVAREEPIFWDGELWNTLVVEYRGTGAAGAPQELRGAMWVRPDGLVLKQQAALLTANLTFVRRSPNESDGKTSLLHD
ncbi:MAG TPA: hypothetical protein VFE24_15430 [Pirellulales bacterium]|nr:hypothetical protein [Pirellulales bacterium]